MRTLVFIVFALAFAGTPGPAGFSPCDTSSKPRGDSLHWNRPRFTSRQSERSVLVQKSLKNHPQFPVSDEKVLRAMMNVPRHEFVPALYQNEAYLNVPLPIGYRQTISQPFIVGHMTQLLKIKPGDRILEIGTGSGYQAAVLSELTPYVYTVEIIPELATRAKETFSRLGYSTIRVKTGDGYDGWPEYGPFDGIIVTCAPENIPRPLVSQLKAGGRIVIPVGKTPGTQYMVVVVKNARGQISRKYHYPVRFVPMTGKEDKQ